MPPDGMDFQADEAVPDVVHRRSGASLKRLSNNAKPRRCRGFLLGRLKSAQFEAKISVVIPGRGHLARAGIHTPYVNLRSPDEAKRNPGLLSALAKTGIVCTVISTPIAGQYAGTDVSMQ
jgi:hypothetical protein